MAPIVHPGHLLKRELAARKREKGAEIARRVTPADAA
jgi:hypothetical protein